MLEMLWEPEDPHNALATRFGFGDEDAAARWVARTLAEHWDVRVDRCERIVISARNALAWVETPDGRLLAKWSVATERFPRLSAIARLTRWLDARGLPVSAPLPTRDGRSQIEVDGVSLGVQHEIQGALLDVTDPTQVHAAGAALAHLQDALAAVPLSAWLDSRAEHLPENARVALRALAADPTTARAASLIDWLDAHAELPASDRATLRNLLTNQADSRALLPKGDREPFPDNESDPPSAQATDLVDDLDSPRQLGRISRGAESPGASNHEAPHALAADAQHA